MKIRLLIALLIASVTITSCNDFLTEKEYDFIGPGLVGDSEDSKEYWLN